MFNFVLRIHCLKTISYVYTLQVIFVARDDLFSLTDVVLRVFVSLIIQVGIATGTVDLRCLVDKLQTLREGNEYK